MPQNNQTLLEKTVADQWQTLPSGLTVLVRPMPGYSSTHVIYATKFGSIDRDFCLNGQTVHLPAGVAHFLEHKMFEDEDGDAFAKYAKTGANANAFTSFDRTCYLFTATQQLDESLDVLLGMVTHPYFTEQTIAKAHCLARGPGAGRPAAFVCHQEPRRAGAHCADAARAAGHLERERSLLCRRGDCRRNCAQRRGIRRLY